MPALLEGAKLTLIISIIGLVGGLFIGLVAGFARAYGGWITNNIALVFIEIIRGTPIVVQVMFIYFALPMAFPDLRIDPFSAAVVTIMINSGAYIAEITRGAVEYAKANIKSKDLRQFPNIDSAYMELGTNRADAVLHDTPNILYFIHTAGKGRFKAVGDSIEAQQYGIAFPKGSDDLREKVNGALKTLKENGTYNTLYKKWFGTEPK